MIEAQEQTQLPPWSRPLTDLLKNWVVNGTVDAKALGARRRGEGAPEHCVGIPVEKYRVARFNMSRYPSSSMQSIM